MPSIHRFDACPLAIVGLGVRLPGANSLESYWDMLVSGRHAIAELPESRFNRQRYYQPGAVSAGKSYTQLGGTVPDEDLRPETLGLGKEDVGSADKAHLWFLHTALMALRHAGIDPEKLTGQRMGVFVGHARGSALVGDLTYSATVESLTAALGQAPGIAALPASELMQLTARIIKDTHERYPQFQEDGGPITQPSAAAGLVARRLGTTGPYMAVDAACASSFAALDIAARAIHAGEIESAIVGGCSYNQWSSLVLFSQAQALSAKGSFPFDERADGFISSDGYAAIIIEPLLRSRAFGRKPLAILRGIGGSCDGRGKSLWAPLKEGQVFAISRAYENELTPSSVQVIEAHATGTAVGDATELSALAEVFGAESEKRPIASVKANIGHTRETAGLAGLIKMILAMQKGIVPPAASFQVPSSRIDWSALPFRVPQTAEPWPDRPSQPRRAAVDAFGIGGLNYHVVIDGVESAESFAPPTLQPAISIVIEPEPIAIIGAGVVLPEAANLLDFVRALDQPAKLTPPDSDRWESDLYFDPAGGPYRLRQKLAHFLRGWQFDWRTYKIPPRQVEHSDPMQFLMIDVVAQALRNAGYPAEVIPEHLRTAVYVGSIFGGDFTTRLNIGMRVPEFEEDLAAGLQRLGLDPAAIKAQLESVRRIILERFPVEDQSGSFSSSTLASRVSKYFDFSGPCCAIDAEEASGLAALSAGMNALRAGSCELALCCAGQRLLYLNRFAHYEKTGRLATAERNGFYLTEGAVAFTLRRLSDAKKAGQPILAVLREVSGAASPLGPWPALREAIQLSLSRSASPFVPQRIERFSEGVEKDEAAEREVLHEVYPQKDLPLVSATPTFGMAQGASGLVSLLHLLATEQKTGGERTATALNSIGFRGLAYHALLESGALAAPAEAKPAESNSVASSVASEAADSVEVRIIRMTGASLEALRKRITTADPNLLFAAAANPREFNSTDDWRLAIVATSPDTLRAKLALVREPRDSTELWPALHEQGVFLHQRPQTPPELAFAFSGQGSQYAGMLKDLCARYPQTGPVLSEINRVLAELGQPSFEEIVWDSERAERLGSDTWLTQIAVFCGDMLMHSVLREMGLSPSLFFAHSYGEYPALCAAGAWSLSTAIRATYARCQALAAIGEPPGKLISTSASAEQIAELMQRFAARGFVAPANFNSPEQTVLAVENALSSDVIAAIEASGQIAKLLPVPQPYHSRLLAPAQPALKQALALLPLRPPRMPFLSGVGNSYVADPEEIRRRLVEQLTAPLRFIELVRRAYADGIRVFIEVGPRTVLTRLIRSILKSEPVMALCTDHPKVSAAEQMARVKALLETQDLWPKKASPTQTQTAPTAQPAKRAPTAIPHFDATERRRSKLSAQHAAPERHAEPVQHSAESHGSPSANSAAAQTNEMERFLINFVCEQTGYPPEVIGLDQDLEADLGIDSIKKAQMLGELRDQFNLKLPTSGGSGLSLAKIITLRDVSKLLATHAKPNTEAGAAAKSAPTVEVSAPPAAAPNRTESESAADGVRIKTFTGSPYEIGKQQGEAFAGEIERSMRRYRDLLGINVLELDQVKAALAREKEFFDAPALEEMAGIAAGCGLSYERIVVFNLGLEPEHGLFGCTQIAVRAAKNADLGLIHAANEDSPIALRLGNQMVRYVQVRHPSRGGVKSVREKNACCTFASPGQLGGINGINAAGLAVSSTMLLDQPRDLAATGAIHPCLVLRILEDTRDIEEAIELVRSWPRAGAWSLLLSHAPSDQIVYLEYDGARLELERVDDVVVTSNHSRLLSAGEVPEHSQHRLTRLSTLLANRPLQVAAIQTMLRDRTDLGRGRLVNHRTMNTVCRVDNQISFVYAAQAGQLFVTPGPERGEQADKFGEFQTAHLWPSRRDTGRLMRRFILRTDSESATPQAATAAVPRALPTLIIGGFASAEFIGRALRDSGCEVQTVATAEQATLERLPQRLLFLNGLESSEAFFDARADVRLRALQLNGHGVFSLVQRWILALRKAGQLAGAELAAVTAMGGDLGFGSGRELHPAGGALSGLFKALRREVPELHIKLVDTLAGEPPALLLRCLLAELTTWEYLEVGYVRGRRQRVRMLTRELDDVPSDSSGMPGALARVALTPDSAWLVTGGGRGVTSLVARELGRRFGVRLHLLGSTPLGDIPAAWKGLDAAGLKALRHEIFTDARQRGLSPQDTFREVERRIGLHATLDGFREAGIEFRYHAVDLADAAALEQVLSEIRASGVALRGILHGAGVESACELGKKSEAGVRATLNSKVLGLMHLLALTARDPLEAIVGFGSVSGRFGGLGQTDYSLASDLMAKLLTAHRKTTGVRTTTIAWPAWGEVGMAVRPESRIALEAAGQEFMPTAEGVEHLIRELLSDLKENEIVILDHPALLDADHTMPPADALAEIERRATDIGTTAILDGILIAKPRELLVAESYFDPRREVFLSDHQFEGKPILPAVIGLEALAESALLGAGQGTLFALEDVAILAGMRFYSHRPLLAQIHIQAAPADGSPARKSAKLYADSFAKNGTLSEPLRLHISAFVTTEVVGEPPVMLAPPAGAEWHAMRYLDGPVSADPAEARRVYHGPALRTLQRVCGSSGAGQTADAWGELVAPPISSLRPDRLSAIWRLPAALLDGCLVACGAFARKQLGLMSLPGGFPKLVVRGLPPPEKRCIVHLRLAAREERYLTFDFALHDEDGRALVWAEGYRAIVLAEGDGKAAD